jgi:steroid delta-isomerase-like uncharacterized protein
VSDPVSDPASNKAIYRRFHNALGTRDLGLIAEAVDEVVDPDVLFHTPVPMDVTGKQAFTRVWTVLLRAFPDIRVTVEDTIAEGDRVVFRNTVTGTHLGEYRGLPPTGRSVTYDEIFVVRFAHGRVVEVRGVVDVLSQLRQLGVIEV